MVLKNKSNKTKKKSIFSLEEQVPSCSPKSGQPREAGTLPFPQNPVLRAAHSPAGGESSSSQKPS